MKRWSAVLWVVVVGSVGCKARHDFLKPAPSAVEQQAIVFNSGLRLIVERHPATERVAVAALVGAGSGRDAAGREGTAHFLEHLAFRSRPAQRLSMWDELDVAGTSAGQDPANAETTLDTTAYFTVMSASHLGPTLPLFASLLTRPLLGVDDATLEVEREVVRNEQLQRNAHGGGTYLAGLGSAVFGANSAWARPVSGTSKSLAAITRADLEAFVRAYYRPERVTIVMVGDVTPAEAQRLVRASLPPEWTDASGQVAPAKLEVLVPEQAPSADRPVVEAEVEARELVLAWALPGTAASSGSAVELFEAQLTVASSSSLKALGVKSGKASVVASAGASILAAAFTLEPTANLEAVAVEVRKQVVARLPSREQVRRRALKQLSDEQNLLQHALDRAQRAFVTGDTMLPHFGLTEQGWAELETVKTVWLAPERARELLVVPRVATNDTSVGNHQRTQTGVRGLVVTPELITAQLRPVSLGEAREFTLANGLRVVFSRRKPVPVTSVTLALPFGARHATFMTSQLLGPTLRFNMAKNRDVARLSEPDVTVDADVTRVTLSGPAWELPVMLDAIGHGVPPEVSWDRVLGMEWLLEVMQERADEHSDDAFRREAARALVSSVMPQGSLALPLLPGATFDAERAQFVDFVDLAFVPDGAALHVDGDFDFDTTEQIVRSLFTDWKGTRAKAAVRALGELPQRPERARLVDVPGAAQTVVHFACRLPPAETRELRGGQQLLAQALGLSFEDELRRERGMTYGVNASVTDWSLEPNLLEVSMRLDARDRQAALGRFLDLLESLDGAVWDPAVVDLARWRLARRTLGEQFSSAELTHFVAGEMARGATLTEARDLARQQALTPLKWVDAAWEACAETAALELQGHAPTIEALLQARRKKGHQGRGDR